MQHINLFRNLETVVRELRPRGHETVLLHRLRSDSAKDRQRFLSKEQKMVSMGRGLEVAGGQIPNLALIPAMAANGEA